MWSVYAKHSVSQQKQSREKAILHNAADEQVICNPYKNSFGSPKYVTRTGLITVQIYLNLSLQFPLVEKGLVK